MATFGQRLKVASRAAVGIFSENSLRQAAGMLSGVLPGGMGTPPTRGTAEFLRAYSEMPWLRATAGRIATSVARADWQLFVVGKPTERARRGGIVTRVQRCTTRAIRATILRQLIDQNELKQIDEHPFLDVISKANTFQTGLGMRKLTQLHLDLVGDAFWLKERDAQGTIIGVWPVPPHWVIATPTPSRQVYRVSFRGWRGEIPDTEFVWFSDDDPLNPYARGTGAARSLTDELETDEYAAKHTKSFFFNSARPDLLIWPKGASSRQAEIDRLEEDWLSKVQGFWRAFKPYFLSREVDVKELDSMGNFRALQLVQLRAFERDTILQTFGVPPEILGVLENSNRATIDAADYLMSRYVVEPRLEFLRSVLQERLLPEYDDRLILEFVSPVQEDKTAQMEAAKLAPWAMNFDEWRKMAGKPAMEDKDVGKLHMVPNLVQPFTTDRLMEPPPPPPAPFGGGPAGPGPQPQEPPKPKPHKRAIDLHGGTHLQTGLIEEDIQAAVAAGDIALAEELGKAIDFNIATLPAGPAIAAQLEPGLARTLMRVWRDHASRIDMTALAGLLGPRAVIGDVVTALDPAGLAAAQTAALEPQLGRGFTRGASVGATALRRIGVAVRDGAPRITKPRPVVINLNSVNPLAVQWAQEHAGALADVSDEIRIIIAALIARSIEEGIPPREVARLLRDTVGLRADQVTAVANFRARLLFSGVEAAVVAARTERYAQAQQRARALAIARTELNAALNRGQQALWETAIAEGALKQEEFVQIWITTDDDRLCDECEPLGDTTATIGGSFTGGSVGPPLHTNCRCTIGLQAVPRNL